MALKYRLASIMFALLMLVSATCATASAATYEAYDGNPSTSQIQYFKDAVPNIGLGEHYVAFRSGQYSYDMVIGDISFSGGVFSATDSCTVLTLETSNSYNGYYSYSQNTIDSFYLNPEDKIIYSDLGYYPQLEERGTKYEILTLILIVAVCVGYVASRILGGSLRR